MSEEPDVEVQFFSDALGRLSRRLRMVGLLLVLCALGSMSSFLGARAVYDPDRYWNESELLSTVAAAFAVAGIAGAAFWEQLVRRGRAFAESLTDAVQDAPTSTSISSAREWRFAVREFERSAELPLVPGRYGVTIYVGLFLLEIVLIAILWP